MFFLLSLCFTKRGEDRVVLIFPPKGMSVERGCYQAVCRKGYQGRLCVACPQCVSSSAFKGCFWISSLPRTSQWPHQSVFLVLLLLMFSFLEQLSIASEVLAVIFF